ncbi:hypothetical protein N5D77_06095 [Comamonas thiooxydans]|uniref:Uncharacterized protein n=1 Tax=Comamonas thiooxydans TaxID=363952 RepID=A0AA42TRC1_9BURK|nr:MULTISPECIES: hypothetical protein [Comamonas]MDH1333271.1 hypothetical protein [Comamonas thiooxydans]MDH1738956.1 hypothetical protein [Comamonas thiooxydans]MDH1786141.1 hypothetical protein [Comamonas thiooxydans]
MPAVDLIFKRALTTGNPVELVFGDDGGGGQVPDATLTVAARMPGLRVRSLVHVRKDLVVAGRMPGLRCSAVVRYNTDTPRPVVAEVVADAQQAQPVEQGWVTGWQDTDALPAGWVSTAQDAMPMQEQLDVTWQDGKRQGVAVQGRFQQARPLPGATTQARWQEAQSVRASLQTTAEDAAPVRAGWAVRFQESLRDRRRMLEATAQDAMGLQYLFTTGAGPSVPLYRGFQARYQQAMRPPAGKSQVKPPEPEKPGCYEQLVGGPIKLLFCKPWAASTALVFACCKDDGPQPGKVIVPVRKVYIVLNQIVLTRLDTGVELPALAFNMSLDFQSWTWNWTASLHKDAALHLGRDTDGDPAQFLANVNGVPFKLRLERTSRDRRFLPQERWSVSGRGLAAVLAEPWAKSMSFGSPTQTLTAQQLAAEVLKVNGVSIGWDIDWQLEDWQVPAGAWTLQGSYIDAINDIAAAAGGYVQPHNTDQVLRILPKYPTAPWHWDDVVPDFEIPSAVAEVEGTEFVDKPDYNRVFVGGVGAGVFGPITRAGTAGELVAPQVMHALITDTTVQRQRGLAELANTNRQAILTLTMPVLPEAGVILPGKFVRYQGSETAMGIVRSTAVSWAAPRLRQTLEIETHA